ncbi:MAG: transposase zinc-binding domain-containing protein [Bacteroidales bacterium]|nr:transposase zinc-binding domain-containing protein [Bacteroidales bacterium]
MQSRFYNSCGKKMTDKWTSERLSDVLKVEYHHLVFYCTMAIKKHNNGQPQNYVKLDV